MESNIIASFLNKQGKYIFKTKSCWWFNEYSQNHILFSFPLHKRVKPDRDELKEIFSKKFFFAIHYLGNSENNGDRSFIWVRKTPYQIEDLSGNIRSKIRRGLKNCEIKKITFSELCSQAYTAHKKTIERHGEKATSLGISNDLDLCSAYEAWGAYINNQLIAYLVTVCIDDWGTILVSRSANSYLKYYPNNALIYSITQELLSRSDINIVSYGLNSMLEKHDTLDDFKLSMGFTHEPVVRCITLNPLIKPVFNHFACRVLGYISPLFLSNFQLNRLKGFLRIVIESE